MIVSGASVCNNTACSLCFLGPCVRTPCAFLWHIAFLDDCCSNRKALSTALHEVEGSFSLLPLWQYWNRLSQQKPQKKQKAVLTACSTLRASPHPLSKAEVYAVAFCITFFVLFCCCCLFWTDSWMACELTQSSISEGGCRRGAERATEQGQDKCHRKLDNAREPDFPRGIPPHLLQRSRESFWEPSAESLHPVSRALLLAPSKLTQPEVPRPSSQGNFYPVKWFIPSCKEWPPCLGLFHLTLLWAKS